MIRVVAAGLALLLVAAPVARSAELTIEVTGLRNGTGDMRIAIFDKPAEFPRGDERWGLDVPADKPAVTVTVPDVPPGRYAVAVHHDEDRNDKLATNFLGIPEEGYGFSRNARVLVTPPTFKAAAIEVPPDGARIVIRMQY